MTGCEWKKIFSDNCEWRQATLACRWQIRFSKTALNALNVSTDWQQQTTQLMGKHLGAPGLNKKNIY